jgi:hypothetical protein
VILRFAQDDTFEISHTFKGFPLISRLWCDPGGGIERVVWYGSPEIEKTCLSARLLEKPVYIH